MYAYVFKMCVVRVYGRYVCACVREGKAPAFTLQGRECLGNRPVVSVIVEPAFVCQASVSGV